MAVPFHACVVVACGIAAVQSSCRVVGKVEPDEPSVSCWYGRLGCGKNGLEFCCGYGLVVIGVMLALHSKCVLY